MALLAATMLCWLLFLMSICSLTTGAISSVMSQYRSKNLTWPQHFKLGLLAPWNASFDDYSALTSASAVSIAIEAIQKDPTLSDKMVFSVVTKDSACVSKMAAGNAVKLFIEDNIDVFIGPPCSTACRPAAELASYWNKPIISWVATDPDFNDRKTFSTLGRILGPFSKMGSFMLEVFKQYNWKRVVVISSNYFVWSDAGRAIRMVFEQNNVTIAYSSDFDRLPPTSYITRVLLKAKEEGRRLSGSVMLDDNGDRDPNYNINDMLPNGTFVKIAEILNVDRGKKLAYHLEIGMTGRIVLDNIGDREPDYWITDMSPNGTFIRIAEVLNGDLGKRFLVLLGNYHFRQPFFAYNMLKFPVALKQIKECHSSAHNIGMTGKIVLDKNADREPDYWITDMALNGTFVRIADVLNSDLGKREAETPKMILTI
ncbi:hypothetical protein CAPTEDRAFT_202805 [Capitella teleta]|uniref:Receptor ligand binding region domain-containing protein n=1 Tax=Capitella teleta TaxID=283909 RepID=R7V0J0_CAPTE|nr:hypothetical protein CAPTEDRAFT_202805 [Capitella teleta]|eukprot:ELU09191.1 hypothetical protein CAPTEDRAFT_202805 [Capitella teleta]